MELTRRSVLLGTATAGLAVALTQAPAACLARSAVQERRPTPASGRRLSVLAFGARGDGRSDDRAAIQAAIDAVAGSGGGTVLLPAGTYRVTRAGRSAVAISLRSGVFLEGEGRGTVVRLATGSGGHVVNVQRERDCGIRNLTIDGNRSGQSSTGHGIRSGGVRGFRLESLSVVNAYHYGIGLEGDTNSDVLINDVVIDNCGGDGIDIKNRNNANALVTITNVTIARWGVRTGSETQAAIDCRGQVRLENIRIRDPGADDSVGIRMRQGELRDRNGIGAHGSSVNGFEIRMAGGRRQIGIAVVARRVSLAGGTVSGGFRGMVLQGSDCNVSRVAFSGCSDAGVLIDSGTDRFSGDRAVLSSCSITDCAGNGIEVEADDVQIVECSSQGNGRNGLLIKGTASGTRVVRGDFSRNRGSPILNLATNSAIAALAG